MSASGEIRVIPLPLLGEIVSGDDLVEKLAEMLNTTSPGPRRRPQRLPGQQ